jgi:hypothetical protein
MWQFKVYTLKCKKIKLFTISIKIGSWPAQVLILQTISGLYQIPKYYGSFYQISKTFICGGTLINLDTSE